jgi:hypothetical protein
MKAWSGRVPRIWLKPELGDPLHAKWQLLALLGLLIVLPSYVQGHFWRQLHSRDLWCRDAKADLRETSSLWRRDPNRCEDIRFGDRGAHLRALAKQPRDDQEVARTAGVTFLPLWEPLLMVTLGAVSLSLVIVALVLVFRKPTGEQRAMSRAAPEP